MPNDIMLKVSEPSISPPMFVDASEVLIHIVDNEPQHVMLLAINVSPFQDEDGTVVGEVTGKWVMPVKLAKKLANDLQSKLTQVHSEVVETHGGS